MAPLPLLPMKSLFSATSIKTHCQGQNLHNLKCPPFFGKITKDYLISRELFFNRNWKIDIVEEMPPVDIVAGPVVGPTSVSLPGISGHIWPLYQLPVFTRQWGILHSTLPRLPWSQVHPCGLPCRCELKLITVFGSRRKRNQTWRTRLRSFSKY